MATLRVRRVAATSHYRRFDVFGSFSKRTSEEDLAKPQRSLRQRHRDSVPPLRSWRLGERKQEAKGHAHQRARCDLRLPAETNLLLQKEAKCEAEADFTVRRGGILPLCLKTAGSRFYRSKGVLNLATGGVHAVSLWPAGKGLKAVDYISFSRESAMETSRPRGSL